MYMAWALAASANDIVGSTCICLHS